MKSYEENYRQVLPKRTYTLIRVDGKSFHSYCKGLTKPYDEQFMADMDKVAEALCKEISGAVMAYSQSDEISILLQDFTSTQTQPWFGGVSAKMISITAALASSTLNSLRMTNTGKMALFDSRAFTISDPVDVANYFVWRQKDAIRNSVAMAAQTYFPHKQLQGLNTTLCKELLLKDKGIDWQDYPEGFKKGRVTLQEDMPDVVSYVDKRSKEEISRNVVKKVWKTTPALEFKASKDTFLAEIIPVLPGF